MNAQFAQFVHFTLAPMNFPLSRLFEMTAVFVSPYTGVVPRALFQTFVTNEINFRSVPSGNIADFLVTQTTVVMAALGRDSIS